MTTAELYDQLEELFDQEPKAKDREELAWIHEAQDRIFDELEDIKRRS